MSLPQSVYTGPNGGTVPGQQIDQTQQMLTQAAMSGAQGNVAAMPSDQALNSAATNTSTQLAGMETPQARQTYVNNGDLPAMQSNYDDLARKLFDADKLIANSGQFNPTPASDASSSAGVAASPLELTSGILGGNSFSPNNPEIGMKTQITGQNNIADLLNVLNSSISKEFTSRKGTYASTVGAQKDLLESIFKVMGMKNTLAIEQAKLAMARSDRGQESMTKVQSQAEKLKDGLRTGEIQWGDAWNSLKSYAGSVGASVSPQDLDTMLGGKFNASDPDGTKGLTTGWAKPGAYQDYNAQKKITAGTAFSDKDMSSLQATSQSTQLANEAIDILTKNPGIVGTGFGNIYAAMAAHDLTGAIPNENVRRLVGIMTQLRALGEKNAVGGRLTGYLLDRLSPSYPALTRNAGDNIQMFRDLINFAQQDVKGQAQDKRVPIEQVPHYGEIFSGNQAADGAMKTDINSVVQKLKATGKYNDTQINAYLRAKGLQ